MENISKFPSVQDILVTQISGFTKTVEVDKIAEILHPCMLFIITITWYHNEEVAYKVVWNLRLIFHLGVVMIVLLSNQFTEIGV